MRWLPAAVVPVVIAVGVLALPLQATADVNLPAKTPQQVLALVAHTTVSAFSGTLSQTSNLGLPDLGSATGMGTGGTGSGSSSSATSAATSALELLTGSHTARIYVDGSAKLRVQVLDNLAERDVIRNGADVWLYASATNAVTHAVLPTRTTPVSPVTPGTVVTPEQLAARFLAKVAPTTTVSVGTATSVAGRATYDLVLTPKATDTLIGSVSVAVDAETGLPLSVDVQARGQKDPAFEVAYTSITLAAPDASMFAFTPPAGAAVTQQALPTRPDKSPMPTRPATPKYTVTGTAWDAIVALPAGDVPAALTGSPLYSELTTAVVGGRALSTSLVNVFLASDGRVFAGSVPLGQLQAAAGK
jgi:outer membrane lipoprotein-sorting protein